MQFCTVYLCAFFWRLQIASNLLYKLQIVGQLNKNNSGFLSFLKKHAIFSLVAQYLLESLVEIHQKLMP